MFYFTDEVFHFARCCFQKFRKSYRIEHFGILSFNIVKAEDAKLLLRTTQHMEKGLVYKLLEPHIKNGVIRSENTKWQMRRRLMTATFHFGILKQYFDKFRSHSDELVDLLISTQEGEVHIIHLVHQTLLQMFCGLSFKS